MLTCEFKLYSLCNMVQKFVFRKLKNRAAAQSARDRKKERMTQLEEEVQILMEENQKLQEENEKLRLKTGKNKKKISVLNVWLKCELLEFTRCRLRLVLNCRLKVLYMYVTALSLFCPDVVLLWA